MATRIQQELDGVDLVAHCIAASPEGRIACMNPIVTSLATLRSQFALLVNDKQPLAAQLHVAYH